MNKSLSYADTLLTSNKSKIDVAYWDTVLDLYEEKKYKEALVGVIKYANKELIQKYGNADETHFEIPHGSVTVKIDIQGNHVNISAPFLIVPTENPVPLYRQVAQINFSPLNLTNIELEGDQLVFRYSCELDECEPYKMYDVFRDICIYADSYDDEFIKKFNAKWIKEPVVTPYSSEKNDKIWSQVQAYINEAFSYIQHFEEKRLLGFCWDVLVITIMKIDNYCSPEGFIRGEIEKNISYLMKSNDQLPEKVNKGKKFLEKLKKFDKNEFIEDLYDAEIFIPSKSRTTDERLKEILKSTHERAKSELDKGDHTGATLSIQYIFFYALYYYNMEDKYYNTINNSLRESSGKDWHIASQPLWKAIDDIMNDRVGQVAPQKKRKGFFSSLFGG